MKHEYEAKFLAIDSTALQAKLAELGASKAFGATLSGAIHPLQGMT